MTVAELIEALGKHPGELPVYVSGYEDGVDDVTGVKQVQVRRDVNPEWCYGDHDVVDLDEDSDEHETSPSPGLILVGG